MSEGVADRMLTPGTPTTGATTEVCHGQGGVAEQAANAPAASIWRHLVLEIDVPNEQEREQAIQSQLDRIAAQGWELVDMTSLATHLPAPGGMAGLRVRDTLLAAFKRRDRA